MRPTLVDANVLLDLATNDSRWVGWSRDALLRQAAGGLAINPIIYAEVSVAYETLEQFEAAISPLPLERRELPWEAAFLAGRCFVQYRRRGGSRRSPLPGFYIGAHAAVANLDLLTRDPDRYRSYFPGVRLIAP